MALEHPDGWAFNPVGGLEVATTPERLADLHRKAGLGTGVGHRRPAGRALDECVGLHPLLDERPRPRRIPHPHRRPGQGACARPRRRRGGPVTVAPGSCPTPKCSTSSTRAAGSPAFGPPTGVIDADVVVCAAGFWGAQLATQVGLVVPLVPMAHQYAKTGQVPAARRTQHRTVRGGPADPAPPGPGPVLPRARRPHRHRLLRPPPDAGRHVDADGRHRGRVDAVDAAVHRRGLRTRLGASRSNCFPLWAIRRSRRPSTASSRSPRTASRIMGEHRELRGFWVAEAVWVTHSAGVAKAMAEWIVDGAPVDRRPRVRPVPVRGRGRAARSSSCRRSSQAFVEVYDIIHPHQYRTDAARPARQPVPRPAARTRRVLLRGRRLGAARLVRGQRRTGAELRRRRGLPGARRLVGAVLVADLGRRGALDPRARRAVRHDAADPLRGQRARALRRSCSA